jgi:hypothetical protein
MHLFTLTVEENRPRAIMLSSARSEENYQTQSFYTNFSL